MCVGIHVLSGNCARKGSGFKMPRVLQLQQRKVTDNAATQCTLHALPSLGREAGQQQRHRQDQPAKVPVQRAGAAFKTTKAVTLGLQSLEEDRTCGNQLNAARWCSLAAAVRDWPAGIGSRFHPGIHAPSCQALGRQHQQVQDSSTCHACIH